MAGRCCTRVANRHFLVFADVAATAAVGDAALHYGFGPFCAFGFPRLMEVEYLDQLLHHLVGWFLMPSKNASSRPRTQPSVCYIKHMRLHISLDRDLVDELDRRAGKRQRSAFIAALIRRAIDDDKRWDEIESALGSIAPSGHLWDHDPASWVRTQRETDASRAG